MVEDDPKTDIWVAAAAWINLLTRRGNPPSSSPQGIARIEQVLALQSTIPLPDALHPLHRSESGLIRGLLKNIRRKAVGATFLFCSVPPHQDFVYLEKHAESFYSALGRDNSFTDQDWERLGISPMEVQPTQKEIPISDREASTSDRKASTSDFALGQR
jgi:hypothetical protein